LRRRKIRTRRPELGAALAAALCLAGCGSGTPERRAAPAPSLPAPLAATLAQQSDKVAAALDAGDSCTALTEARRLQEDTIEAINERRVPAAFQEQLVSTVGDLVARIECVPHEDEGRGEGKGKGKKGKGKHKGDE
jgi:hypothetical protein